MDAQKVLVTYGTNQNTERTGCGEFTICTEKMSFLECDTKFCLMWRLWLPLTKELCCWQRAASSLRKTFRSAFPASVRRIPHLRGLNICNLHRGPILDGGCVSNPLEIFVNAFSATRSAPLGR